LLFDAARGLYFAPIRHHSPACKALLTEIRPRQVLIEAPIDFDPLIPILLDAGTRPPVAIVAIDQAKGVVAAVELVDAVERRLQRLDRRGLPGAEQVNEVGDRQDRQICR